MVVKHNLKYKLVWGGIFAITMGYFEAALVEYLRELYYPAGFQFPLVDIPTSILVIELFREVASIFMILSVSFLLGSSFIDKFAGFAYCFGIWDIAYYLFLEVFEAWPSSLATIDILFLIPPVWVGPVWAPVAVSIALIWAAWMVWRRLDLDLRVRLTGIEWTLEIIAGLMIISSFLSGAPAALKKELLPPFPWWLWTLGMVVGIVIFLRAVRRSGYIGRA